MTLLTVQFDSVADHAQPLARWVDRMLWRWSPWHLRQTRDAFRGELQDAAVEIRLREIEVRELARRLRDTEYDLRQSRRSKVTVEVVDERRSLGGRGLMR